MNTGIHNQYELIAVGVDHQGKQAMVKVRIDGTYSEPNYYRQIRILKTSSYLSYDVLTALSRQAKNAMKLQIDLGSCKKPF